MSGRVRERYAQMVAAGEIERDPAQQRVADRLDGLASELEAWTPSGKGLFSRFKKSTAPGPRGLYIFGSVGRGKTMLMDLFYESVQFQPFCASTSCM